MLSSQDIVMVIFGIIACFMGYSMFRSALPLWGFLLGGWIAFTFMPSMLPKYAASIMARGAAFVAVGVVGAVVAIPLYYVIIFLSGAALGGIMGIIFGALIDLGGITSFGQLDKLSALSFPPIPYTATQFLFMAVFGVVLGAMSINFQKFMVSASSAFIGSAAIVSGLTIPLSQTASSAVGRGAVMLLAWMIIGLIGLVVQYRVLGET